RRRSSLIASRDAKGSRALPKRFSFIAAASIIRVELSTSGPVQVVVAFRRRTWERHDVAPAKAAVAPAVVDALVVAPDFHGKLTIRRCEHRMCNGKRTLVIGKILEPIEMHGTVRPRQPKLIFHEDAPFTSCNRSKMRFC